MIRVYLDNCCFNRPFDEQSNIQIKLATEAKLYTELRLKGSEILLDQLGLLEAERFIALIQREPFDYSLWSQDLFKGQSIKEIVLDAKEYLKKKKKK
jgi:hypothetical protein